LYLTGSTLRLHKVKLSSEQALEAYRVVLEGIKEEAIIAEEYGEREIPLRSS
jgi:hypothetical protein